MSDEVMAQAIELIDEMIAYQKYNKLEFFKPYPKQKAFFNSLTRETLLSAGNRLGKTLAGAVKSAIYATGLYPDWWTGPRIERPTTGWVLAVNGKQNRDVGQKYLMGDPGDEGSGMLPKDRIGRHILAARPTGLYDYVMVKSVFGGWSYIYFKSYGEGREALQGGEVDWCWLDEEAPEDAYMELLTRTNATLGPVFTTFTPLKGMSRVVHRFFNDPSPDRLVIQMTINDVVECGGHITPETRDKIVAQYPEHERASRTDGTPSLGDGVVFPIAENDILIKPRELPDHWPRIAGIDFGWNHPTASVWLAHDTETDTIYVYDAYRQSEQTPIIHAAAIRERGDWMPIAWPLDGLQTEKGTGVQLKELYRKQGLKMLFDHAKYADDRGNKVEPGVLDMLQRMQTGRFKVFSSLTEWIEEFRLYHRKEGKIVPIFDDLMAATRYALMMLRHAKTKSAGGAKGSKLRYKPTGIV